MLNRIAKFLNITLSHPLLVHKLDRFARNRYDSIRYKSLLRRKGIKVVSATQPIVGSGDPTEILLEAMLEGMDEFYSLNLARESLKGMAENARRGWWNGGHAPFGYQLIELETEKGSKRKLAIEPKEAEVVRRIFQLYRSGRGVGAIRHLLNTEGLTFRGGYPFTKNLVLGILRNEKYCGDATFGKKLNRRKRPMDWKLEPITVKDTHPAIIDRQAWEHVQKILTGRGSATKHPRAVSSDYLFSGLMECGFCKAKFVGVSAHSRGRRYRYYMCNTLRRAGSTACKQPSFNADVLERTFMDALKARLTTKEAIAELIHRRNELLKRNSDGLEGTLLRLEDEIAELTKRRANLYGAIEQNLGFTLEDIAPRLRELDATKAQKELERDQIKAKLADKPIHTSAQSIEELADFYMTLFADDSPWARKQLAQSFIISLRVEGQDASVTFDPALSAEHQRLSLKDAMTAASE
ncbi:MAG: recombinase family protein [Candidatus Omnitrophica bacterium]|nr:recombinase family protein [Candidatus Omnitrophota bacterium]